MSRTRPQTISQAPPARTAVLYVRVSSKEQQQGFSIPAQLLSNCTFDRGSLSATYRKPFDMLVEGNENGNWLGGRDSNPDNGVQSAVSYR